MHLPICAPCPLLHKACDIQQLNAMTNGGLNLQLREKAAVAKEEAGGLAPLAHGVLEAQKEEQRRAADLAAIKR